MSVEDPGRRATATSGEGVLDEMVGPDPEKRRIRVALRGLVLENDRFKDAYTLLEEALDSSGDGRECDSYLLFGASGAGKSTVIEAFCADRTNRREDVAGGGMRQDVLLIRVPSRPHMTDFYRATLTALGAEDDLGKLPEMQSAFMAQVRGMGVRLVIYDEFNNFVEDRTDKFKTATAREIKSFLSKNLFNVVFAGTEDIVDLYSRYGQTKRRGMFEYEMTAYDWRDENDRALWKSFLAYIDEDLPTPAYVPLNDTDLSRKLYQASDGLPSGLIKLLTAASLCACDRDGEDKVREEDFWRGYQRLRRVLGDGSAGKKNPFTPPPSGTEMPLKRRRIQKDDDEQTGLLSRPRTNLPNPRFRK